MSLQKDDKPVGNTIDLRGVASFAALVELLAQELGTTPGRMQGHLPDGPSSFNELVGEIDLHGQGYNRRITLVTSPGASLTLRLQAAFSTNKPPEPQGPFSSGVISDYYLNGTVEAIMPQGRALARYIEDLFAILDRMVTLGQGNKLSTMSVSASDLQAFEANEGQNLIRPASGKPSSYAP